MEIEVFLKLFSGLLKLQLLVDLKKAPTKPKCSQCFRTTLFHICYTFVMFLIPSNQLSLEWNSGAALSKNTFNMLSVCTRVLLQWPMLPGVDTVGVYADDMYVYQRQTVSLRPPAAWCSRYYSTEAQPSLYVGNCWPLWPRTHTETSAIAHTCTIMSSKWATSSDGQGTTGKW